ncbi:MAG: hypothetical protein HY257_03275 [Chloroflexi bacterium]|nr:hypothetical protein [Chloroflexota bacterium]
MKKILFLVLPIIFLVACNSAPTNAPSTPSAQTAPAISADAATPLPKQKTDASPQPKPKDNPAPNQTLAAPQGGPYTHHIESATSSDGLNWSRDNRVLIEHASVPTVIVTPAGNVRLYYVDANNRPENVNCAESSDGGKSFQVLNCAITNLTSQKAVDPSIVLLSDGRYRLYYYAATGNTDTHESHFIRSAISADGIRFTEEGTVFTYNGLVDPDVFWTGKQWLMYVFSLTDHATVIAKSDDGLKFEYVGPLGLKDWGTVAPIKLEDGRFRVYAFNQRTQIAFNSFISSDAINWTQESGDRLTAQAGTQITDPFVVRLRDGTWKMFYKVDPNPKR